MMALERDYQPRLKERIESLFPGCYILKNDTRYIQGIPDLLILWKDRWATLEVKKSDKEPYRPNQEYYISELDRMSFSRMICPENEEEVLSDLQRAFGS